MTCGLMFMTIGKETTVIKFNNFRHFPSFPSPLVCDLWNIYIGQHKEIASHKKDFF